MIKKSLFLRYIILVCLSLFLLSGCSKYRELDDAAHKKVDEVKEDPTTLIPGHEDSTPVMTDEEAESKAIETGESVDYVTEEGESATVTPPIDVESEPNHVGIGGTWKDEHDTFGFEYTLKGVTIYDSIEDSGVKVEDTTISDPNNDYYAGMIQNDRFVILDYTVSYNGDKSLEDAYNSQLIMLDLWLQSEEIEGQEDYAAGTEIQYYDQHGNEEHNYFFVPLKEPGDSVDIKVGFFCGEEYIKQKKIWPMLLGLETKDNKYFDIFEEDQTSEENE